MKVSSEKKTLTVQLTPEELTLLINTLSIAKHLFRTSAEISEEKGDLETSDQLKSRVNLCKIFIDRFVKDIEIGEPTDDTHH